MDMKRGAWLDWFAAVWTEILRSHPVQTDPQSRWAMFCGRTMDALSFPSQTMGRFGTNPGVPEVMGAYREEGER